MKQRIPSLNKFINESNKSLLSDDDLIDIIWTAMTPTDRHQLSRKIGVEIHKDKPNTDEVLNAIKDKEDIMLKFYPELFENVNEEAVKHQSEKDFLQKVISVLEKGGLSVTFEYKKGYMIIRGPGDDEQIKLEYYY